MKASYKYTYKSPIYFREFPSCLSIYISEAGWIRIGVNFSYKNKSQLEDCGHIAFSELAYLLTRASFIRLLVTSEFYLGFASVCILSPRN
jgi:hypothetical protein